MEESILIAAITRRSDPDKPSYNQIAQELLGDPNKGRQLSKELKIYENKRSFKIPATDNTLPDPYSYVLPEHYSIPYQSALIIADLHAPFTNVEGLRFAVQTAKVRGIETCIVAGDIFDFNSISSYRKRSDKVTPIEHDIEYGVRLMRYLADHFTVHAFPGNHDKWGMSHYGITFNELMPADINTTEYSFLFFGSNTIIGHLENYSTSPGVLAAEIALKYHKHAFVGHDHITGIEQRYVQDKEYPVYGVSLGSMLRANCIQYKHEGFNALPHWTNGFALVMDNVATLFREKSNGYFAPFNTVPRLY